jgi:tyrosinase
MAPFCHGIGRICDLSTSVNSFSDVRYLVWTYESTLINECGYNGAQPYWDWSLDNPEYGTHFDQSPVFDPNTGFGGNGAGGSVPRIKSSDNNALPSGTCLGSGPFANVGLTLGPGYNLNNPNPHCLVRNFDLNVAENSLGWTKNVVPLLNMPDYASFTKSFDFPGTGAPYGVHGGGHIGVGGEVSHLTENIETIFVNDGLDG